MRLSGNWNTQYLLETKKKLLNALLEFKSCQEKKYVMVPVSLFDKAWEAYGLRFKNLRN